MAMKLTDEAVLLVDWLNLSIQLKNQRLAFGSDLVTDLIQVSQGLATEKGCTNLAQAHFVGERFSPPVEVAIENNIVAKLHKTRTAKEQADLVLAVLAMDHLHSSKGCPRLFILATGDQDFIPLIERIVPEGAQVVLIVASTAKLTPEYKSIAAQQNVALLPINLVTEIDPIPVVSRDHSSAPILGLLRVCMTSGVLGGDQKKNAQLMTQWGLLSPGTDEDVQMEGLIRQFARSDQRRVAVPGRRATGNKAISARRTSLNFADQMVFETVTDADWVLRRAGSSTKPVTFGELGTGRFNDDDGRRLDRILTALKSVGWLIERPDGTFEARMEHAEDGLLEPLWRVVAEINRRAYDQGASGVDRDDLFRDLRSTPLARDNTRKGGEAARDVIEMARRVGIIDTVLAGQDGYALAVIESHPVVRQTAEFLRTLGQILGPDVGVFLPEHEMLRRMRDHDESSQSPLFGYDTRDRQRVLRVLRRSKLVETGPDSAVKLKHSSWLRKLRPGLPVPNR
jgi:NYN domain